MPPPRIDLAAELAQIIRNGELLSSRRTVRQLCAGLRFATAYDLFGEKSLRWS